MEGADRTTAEAVPAGGARGGGSLVTRLFVVLVLVGLATAALLVFGFAPQTTRTFRDASEELIGDGARALWTQSRDDTDQTADLLVGLIRETAEARRRTLLDLPLGLYGGDVERIRERILEQDGERARQLERNVVVLAGEIERRAAERIDATLVELRARQGRLADGFAQRLRGSFLLVAGLLLVATLTILGFGLYRSVIVPIRALQRATRRIAASAEDSPAESAWPELPAARGAGEIAALTADFRAMVERLRLSRTELHRLNSELEAEVERKTGQLVQAAKMASIGTLAGGVAHEFNNVIGGVRGCLREALEDTPEPARREPLEIALRATERARGIVRQLLDFARPPVERKERVDLRALVGEAVALAMPQARRHGVSVEAEAFVADANRAVDPALVDADPGALHQVFLNLLTNAIQAMPGGGTLSLDLVLDADAIEVAVRDTGVGIAPEHLPHVFDPFYTSKDAGEDPGQRGSGLGLSVSYGIVQVHGGALTAESAVGRGSTFRVRLPRRANEG
jgi:signal transduction histidine kinase